MATDSTASTGNGPSPRSALRWREVLVELDLHGRSEGGAEGRAVPPDDEFATADLRILACDPFGRIVSPRASGGLLGLMPSGSWLRQPVFPLARNNLDVAQRQLDLKSSEQARQPAPAGK